MVRDRGSLGTQPYFTKFKLSVIKVTKWPRHEYLPWLAKVIHIEQGKL